jgi:hypothetical protein
LKFEHQPTSLSHLLSSVESCADGWGSCCLRRRIHATQTESNSYTELIRSKNRLWYSNNECLVVSYYDHPQLHSCSCCFAFSCFRNSICCHRLSPKCRMVARPNRIRARALFTRVLRETLRRISSRSAETYLSQFAHAQQATSGGQRRLSLRKLAEDCQREHQ